jgi:exopolysaccharide production protein ExoQ
MVRNEQKSASSRALWVPVLWLLVSSIRGFLHPGPEDPTYVEGHPYTITFVVLVILGGLILYRRRSALPALLTENKLILLLYCIMGLSILWSFYPWISFKRWVKTIGSLEMVLIVLTEPDPLASFSFAVRRYFCLTIPPSLVLIFFFPSLGLRVYPGEGISWVGLFINRNSLARVAMIFCIYFFWDLTRKGKKGDLFLNSIFFGLSLTALIGSGSRTSTLGFLLGAGTFGYASYLRRKVGIRDVGMTLAYTLVSGIVFLVLAEHLLATSSFASWILDVLGRDVTLTGRTDLWSDLEKVGVVRPFLGHGFGGVWIPGNPALSDFWKVHTWLPMTAHNGYLAVFLETGLLGLITVILAILNTYWKISRSLVMHFDFGRLCMALLLVLIFHNFTETSLCNLSDPLWVMFLFIAVSGGSPAHFTRKNSGRMRQDPERVSVNGHLTASANH